MFQVSSVIMVLITQSKGLPTVSYKGNEIKNDEGIRENNIQKSNPGNVFVGRLTHLENDPFEPVNLLAPITEEDVTARASRAVSTQQRTGIFLHKGI